MVDFKNKDGLYLQNNCGKLTRAGILWNNLRNRTSKTEISRNQSYQKCSIEFINFQDFASWCNDEENYLSKDINGRFYCLDKDIVKPRNTVYSGEYCCFIPQELNMNFSRGDN